MSARRVVLVGFAAGVIACSGKTDRSCNEAFDDCSQGSGGSSGTGATGGAPSGGNGGAPAGPKAACTVCENPWFSCAKPGWESVDFQLESQQSGGCTGRIVMAGGAPSTEVKIHCSPAAVCANEVCSPTELTDTSFTWNGATCSASH